MGTSLPDTQSRSSTIVYVLQQVSVLTDQVEAQGEKIRDLEVCLEGHQVKLNAAEEMLQQVWAGEVEGFGPEAAQVLNAPLWAPAYSPMMPGGGVGCALCNV